MAQSSKNDRHMPDNVEVQGVRSLVKEHTNEISQSAGNDPRKYGTGGVFPYGPYHEEKHPAQKNIERRTPMVIFTGPPKLEDSARENNGPHNPHKYQPVGSR